MGGVLVKRPGNGRGRAANIAIYNTPEVPLLKRLLSFLLAFSLFAFAEGTKTWQQSTFDAFSRGTTKGIAIRSDGSLELAPSFQSLRWTLDLAIESSGCLDREAWVMSMRPAISN